MSTAKVAITIDENVLAKLDRLVKRKVFASRSQAIQEAISDKLEQVEHGEQVEVRREGRFTSEDIHKALFSTPLKRRTLAEMKEGVRRYMKERHARG